MGKSRKERERQDQVNALKLKVLAALQKYPQGQIATVLASRVGVIPSYVGNLLRRLAEEGRVGQRITRDHTHGNLVSLWLPDPHAGRELIGPRPRRDPVSTHARLAKQAFTDAALAREHAEWVAKVRDKPRYNPWGTQ